MGLAWDLVRELSRISISASHDPAATSGQGGREGLLREAARWGVKSWHLVSLFGTLGWSYRGVWCSQNICWTFTGGDCETSGDDNCGSHGEYSQVSTAEPWHGQAVIRGPLSPGISPAILCCAAEFLHYKGGALSRSHYRLLWRPPLYALPRTPSPLVDFMIIWSTLSCYSYEEDVQKMREKFTIVRRSH